MSPHRFLPVLAQVAAVTFVPAIFDDVVIGLAFLGCLGVTLFLYATGQAVPDQLYGLTGIFIGYYVRNMVTAGKSVASDGVNIADASPTVRLGK